MALEILALHMIGDFVLQTDEMATLKLTSPLVRFFHVLDYWVVFAVWGVIFYSINGLYFAGTVAVTHYIIDSFRFYSDHPWPPKSIMVDQTLHIATLAVLARVFLAG